MPFSARLLDLGLDQELALVLFEQGLLTMERAAKLAGLTRGPFMDLMARTGAVAVEYPVEELDGEIQVRI